jgi:hypothetical protein|tara:strand:- start:385 stop:516 length:132 start_codon:yes stop_codon:yes gene_type:complete
MIKKLKKENQGITYKELEDILGDVLKKAMKRDEFYYNKKKENE